MKKIVTAIRADIAETDAYVSTLAPWELYRQFTTACVMSVYIIYGYEQLQPQTLMILAMFGVIG